MVHNVECSLAFGRKRHMIIFCWVLSLVYNQDPTPAQIHPLQSKQSQSSTQAYCDAVPVFWVSILSLYVYYLRILIFMGIHEQAISHYVHRSWPVNHMSLYAIIILYTMWPKNQKVYSELIFMAHFFSAFLNYFHLTENLTDFNLINTKQFSKEQCEE